MSNDLRERTIYSGEHKGIPYEIVRCAALDYQLESGSEFRWCHYIYVYDTQFTIKPELPTPYFTSFGTLLTRDAPWVHQIEFHGGCTYYEIERSDHFGNLLKIGCDYQHYWDEGKNYQLGFIRSEAIYSVESLLNLYPDLIPREKMLEKFRSRFPGENKAGWGGMYDVNGNELTGEP